MPRALVTGASAGIGEAFARELAARGHALVLVARDDARLGRLAATLPADCEVLPADLADGDALARVEARLGAEPPVDLLVNNAGVGTYGRFVDLDVDGEEHEVRVNALAVVRLAHAAARSMTARGSGAIVNVSSLSGYQPIPGNATYAATKAFVTSFGEALHAELRPLGVRVTTVCPGYTHTEFHARAGVDPRRVPELLWQDPEAVARAALDALERGRAVCVPGVLNRAAAVLSPRAPRILSRKVAHRLNGRIR